jgi:hypothetical protein
VWSVFVSGQDGPKWVGAFFVQGKVGLKWQKAEGAAEYKIYRKGEGDFQVLTTTGKTQHFDTDVSPGKIYTYKIAYSGPDGTELFSKEKTVAIPGGRVGEFVPPIWSGVRVQKDQIMLRWDDVAGAMAYNVYRTLTSGADYEIVGNSVAGHYADKENLARGETYYYVVTALSEEFEETEFSEEQNIKFGLSDEEANALNAEAVKIELDTVKFTYLFELTAAGDNGPMNQPAGVSVNSQGNIYVTDALKQRVNCYDSDGKYLFSFGSKSEIREGEPIPEGTFSMPYDVFVDKQDRVYVADISNHDIQVFDAKGEFIRRIKVETSEDQEPFKPAGLHVLDDGRLVVSDGKNHRWLIIDQEGNILQESGKRGDQPGMFNFPGGLTVTDDGIVCIVDIINCRVQEFDLEGNFLRAFGGVGKSVGSFARPKTVAAGEDGRLWVTDGMMHSVQAFTVEGEVKVAMTSINDGEYRIQTPRGMFFKDNRFYLINRLSNQVLVFRVG